MSGDSFPSAVHAAERVRWLSNRLWRFWILEDRIRAYYVLGRYDDMFACAKSLPFQTRCSRIYRAVVVSRQGDKDRARQLIAATLADDPKLTSEYLQVQELYRDESIKEAIISYAEEAGLPRPDDIVS